MSQLRNAQAILFVLEIKLMSRRRDGGFGGGGIRDGEIGKGRIGEGGCKYIDFSLFTPNLRNM